MEALKIKLDKPERLLTKKEVADRLSVGKRQMSCDHGMHKLCVEHGMFRLGGVWKMREKDLDLFIMALASGIITYTGVEGTQPEPGDSQCASQPVNQGSDGEPSGPELANYIPQP